MNFTKKISSVPVILTAVLLIMISGCSDNPADNPLHNKAPDTFLFLYPDSTISGQPSKIKVSWWGDDPDGLIIGYYFKWKGIDSTWSFTTGNDSVFTLPIGSADTTYDFVIAAADGNGNGKYDNTLIQNGINFGHEPFIDVNGNGIYDKGEKYFDVGLIDPTPADLKFPIKNTAPEIAWNQLTVLPDTSFPVMTFAWDASDLDGDETITHINVALNDTADFIALDGSTRLITIRTTDFNVSNPEMEILIGGSDQNIFSQTLPGLIFNDNNKIYVQAVDLSGAKTKFIEMPDSNHTWFVKKPKGQLLLVDDYSTSNSDAAVFYRNSFSTINGGNLAGKFDVYNFEANPLPFQNVTFPQTAELFKYIFWYSSSQPRIDLLGIMANDYRQNSGKIMLSMVLEDSSASFAYDVPTLKSFLPIDSVGYKRVSFLYSPSDILPGESYSDYPVLQTSETTGPIRLFYPSLTAQTVYNLHANQLSGPIGFLNNDKNLFFIGIPLNVANGGEMNVNQLIEKVFFEEFGLLP